MMWKEIPEKFHLARNEKLQENFIGLSQNESIQLSNKCSTWVNIRRENMGEHKKGKHTNEFDCESMGIYSNVKFLWWALYCSKYI